MSSTSTLSVNNILSFNGHGGKVNSGKNTFTLPENVYVLVPFGIGVDGIKKPDGSAKQKTDEKFKGLNVCYTTPAPNTTLTFEEIIYGVPGKLKFTFNSNVDAKWHLYKPKEQVPNVEYYSFKPSDAAGGSAQNCDSVAKNYKSYIKDLMNACLSLKDNNNLNKKVCAYFVSKSDTPHNVFTDSAGNYHLKLKICGDGKSPTTTLQELAENCHKLVEFSRDFVKNNKSTGETYEGYTDENIFPKSGTNDPIILLPFVCNSCNSGQDIQLSHNYINDNSDASLKPLSDIIADLSGGGGGGGDGGGGIPADSSDPVPLGKVAQFFMTFNKDNNGGLSGYDQCRKIVNVVKCLITKGYKHIGLTYSANQEQTNKIWKEYNYPTAKDFDNEKEKTILQTGIGGTNQAETIGIHNKKEKNTEGKWVDMSPEEKTTYIDDLTRNSSDENSNFRKAFRIIPFSTMATGGGTTEVNIGSPGDINGCIEAAKNFLQLEKSIILGWCNQDIEILTDSNKDSFNKDYTIDDAGKFPFAIGGGIGGKAKLPNLFKTYLGQYFKYLTSVWDPKVQKIVTECSPDPKSVGSPASPPPKEAAPTKDASSKETPPVEKKPFTDILTNLEGQLSDQPDDSIDMSTIGINSPPNFLYPLNGSDTDKKNLNCATPLITYMITEFESAADDGDKDFYLGACKSIQAAYDLDVNLAGDDGNKKLRAKLLLNLRKNSLLLKVPKGWDYAEMKMGKVSGPPDTLDGLMKFSLQDTIEYYSQAGGATKDEQARFKELNIAEKPKMDWKFDSRGTEVSVSGVDERFTKGISNVLGHSCYFASVNQLFFTNEDFLQFLLTATCKPIEDTEYISSSDKRITTGCETSKLDDYKLLVNYLKVYFKEWLLKKSDTAILKDNTLNILKLINIETDSQQDVSEILQHYFNNLTCISNIYLDKFLDNLIISTTNVKTYPEKTSNENIVPLNTRYQNTTTCFININKNIGSEDNTENITTTISEILQEYLSEKKSDFQYGDYNFKIGTDEKTKFTELKNTQKSTSIIYIMNRICMNKDNNDFKNKQLSGYLTQLNSAEYDKDDSVTYINKYIDVLKNMDYFKNKNDETFIEKFLKYIQTSINSKNLTADDIYSNCDTITTIYKYIDSELTKLITPPENNNKYSETNQFDKTSKYFIIYINRTLSEGKKNFMNVTIDKSITIENETLQCSECNKKFTGEKSNDYENITEHTTRTGHSKFTKSSDKVKKKYILQGFSVHRGENQKSGHYVFVKCDSFTGVPKLALDDGSITSIEYQEQQNNAKVNNGEVLSKGVTLLIYKQEDSSIPPSPGGGGFKPRHNATTNHSTSKSKHNSSFKVSSSSKAKVKSRSHTQRVK